MSYDVVRSRVVVADGCDTPSGKTGSIFMNAFCATPSGPSPFIQATFCHFVESVVSGMGFFIGHCDAGTR